MAESKTSPGPIIGRMLPSGDGTGSDDTGQVSQRISINTLGRQ